MNSELNTQAPTEKQIKSVEKAIDYFKNARKWEYLKFDQMFLQKIARF